VNSFNSYNPGENARRWRNYPDPDPLAVSILVLLDVILEVDESCGGININMLFLDTILPNFPYRFNHAIHLSPLKKLFRPNIVQNHSPDFYSTLPPP